MLASISFIVGLSALLIFTGIKMQPGLGIIGALIVIPLVMWIRGNAPSYIGLQSSIPWTPTILQSLGYALVIWLISVAIIDPFSELLTHTTQSHGPANGVEDNWIALAGMLAMVWLFVAVAEEVIFRGFFMSEISKIIGDNPISLALNLLITSVVFGFCHSYQKSSGIISTGAVGALLGLAFLISGRNLWIMIFTHGFIDTMSLLSIYFGYESHLRQLMVKLWSVRF